MTSPLLKADANTVWAPVGQALRLGKAPTGLIVPHNVAFGLIVVEVIHCIFTLLGLEADAML